MFVGAYMSATNYPWEPDLPVIAIIGLALGVLAAACYGTIVIARIDPVAGWTIGITIVYFTLLAAEFGVAPRLVVPFAPLYAIAAGTRADRLVHPARPPAAKGRAGVPS